MGARSSVSTGEGKGGEKQMWWSAAELGVMGTIRSIGKLCLAVTHVPWTRFTLNIHDALA